MKWLRKQFDAWVIRLVNPIITREMAGWREYLDLQHGLKYSFYADGLQGKVTQLREHVDDVKNVVAKRLMEYDEVVNKMASIDERSLADRNLYLKLRERIAKLEERLAENA